ncbi:MAG TPA: DUF3108 domain-containing protein [Opitutaceae bacterium]|nr:DUF3108 domain-containing protein [Opitutaceae bacterium]
MSIASVRAETGNRVTQALRDGEALNYRVGWGLFSNAAEIEIMAKRETPSGGGSPLLRVSVNTATHGLISTLYSYQNHAESLIDVKTGQLLSLTQSGRDGSRLSQSLTEFDYLRRKAHYSDYSEPDNDSIVPLPEGNPLDLITALVQTRGWNLRPGERDRVLISFGSDFYELMIQADRVERVRTPMGTFDALLLVPTLIGEPKGMFKKGAEVRVWISQDELHLPVKLELQLKVGSVVAVLANYRPPTLALAQSKPHPKTDS